MSAIDELLDDLGQVSWFSKLNMRQGFHQIRMADDDARKISFHTYHDH